MSNVKKKSRNNISSPGDLFYFDSNDVCTQITQQVQQGHEHELFGNQRNDIMEFFPRILKWNRRQLPQRYHGKFLTLNSGV